ncbi:Ig-like domain-containing protein [Flavobacterium cerinum]|uniref:T9SS type A sorting domain-containing protein n=1 Tax=Flavobacterium cerinum TaxID=2502784 RepID=A0A3S4T1S5_9FLAO|nr:T9SS type A sorting domain-containing protein [Flavobacterium cerinum]RWX00789.1 T9SS type A sorting domain-containing protein [Flavobacterium cerinum]
MRLKLQLLLYIFFVFGTLLFTNKGYSQINYSQDFESETFGWDTEDGFFTDDYLACSGFCFQAEVFSFPEFGAFGASSVSESIGISNGQLATLSYNFKILNSDETALPNSPDWGTFVVEYATSLSGPWTVIQTISPANHTESEDCVIKTATFTPTGGNTVYLRITGTPNENEELYYYFFVDGVTVTQAASLACTGAPPAMTTIAAKTNICNGEGASLSLNPYPISSGLVFQWQKSTDGVAYTNIAGGTGVTLTAAQTVSTWYRANVSCGTAGVVVTSTPVQVVNSGLPCLCEVVFGSDVEPITRVQFAGINNVTSAVVNGTPDTQNFSSLTPGQVTAGSSYPIVLEGNTNGPSYNNYFKVYIDFNHNGNLNDPGESFEIGFITGSNGTDGIQATGTIAIPNNATPGLTYMRVFKLYNEFSVDPCTNDGDDYSYGQVEDYLLNVAPGCTTAAPTAANTQSFCAGATVANLAATGTGVKWYLSATVGSPLGAAIPLDNGTIYYASQTIGCESITRAAVTVTINAVTVDNVADVSACNNYVLPALVNGNYFTETDGGGDMLSAGDIITENTTLYVYKEVGTTTVCSAEDSFVITITNIAVDDLDDVSTCSDYVLPVLENGAYYTAAAGGGSVLSAGDVITETATIYIYAVSDVNPACSAENSFTVTINEVTAPDLDDVTACFEYVLPVLENGAYYTATAGGGTMLAAGNVITENATVYVYVVSGSNPACNAESSFAITINAPVPPSGNSTVEYISNEDVLLYDIEVTATGVVAWYETEEDAESGENPLSEDTIVPAGTTTYYATQTIGECESAPFAVTVDVVLGVKGFNSAAFNYYPNPVNDVLNLSYSNTITGVTVFNLLGQEVVAKNTDQNVVQIDLSQLAAGTYMVKVQSEDAYKVIKLVKR